MTSYLKVVATLSTSAATPTIENTPAAVSIGNYTATPHTLTLPTSRSNDDLILFIVSTSINSAGRGSITGYTEIGSSIQDNRGVQLFGRVADGTEAATVDLAGFTGSQNTVAIPILVRGAAGLPTGGAIGTAVVDNGTTLSSPAATGTGLVLRCVGGQYTMTSTAAITEVTQLQHTYDAGPVAASLWTDDNDSSEAVNMAQSNAGDAGAITVVIAP